ncbi:MAG: sporulation protein YqfD [Solirubrobacterales bacterium]
MRIYNKFNGYITLEIKSLMPEKFVNLLWKSGINIKNIKKIDVSTMKLEMMLKDYHVVQRISRKTNTKVRIIGRRGPAFFIIKYRTRGALFFGVLIFAGMLYFLSTFIWGVDITGDKTLTPYEIRTQLRGLGVKAGIRKNSINVYDLEEKMLKNNDNIMWIRIRIEGSKLMVSAEERQSPPINPEGTKTCNLIASKDGQVERLYAKTGEAAVKPGDIVNKGQVLVKGDNVHAEGTVIARTFYEKIKEVSLTEVKRTRTGNMATSIYLTIGGKKLYLKNYTNKYEKYDKIEVNKPFFTIVNYYEVTETTVKKDEKKVAEDTINELYSSIKDELKPSIKIIDKITNVKIGDLAEVRVLVVAEEDIAVEEN